MIFGTLFTSLGAYLALSGASLFLPRRAARVSVYGGSAIVAVAALGSILLPVLGAPTFAATARLPLGLPWIGVHLKFDALAAFFLSIVNFGGAVAGLYGIGYGRHEAAPGRVLPFFPLFLAAMNLVVLAADAFTFLFAWELMSLSSWALVMAHHREADHARAGYVYLLMASFGTLALLMAFGILAGAEGHYAFADIAAAHPARLRLILAFALILIGAGSKAGLAPLHVWLPLAHPAAPSHISALMSGVMTKVAIYAFIRLIFDLLDLNSSWAGLVLLILGGITAILGVLFANIETDIKKLLAYSTIENVGIVFVGLGLALAFKDNGMNIAAALALIAAMFHVLSHALFKPLLFFGAGAILNATKTRDLEKMGGLIHGMPLTSFTLLAGCVAISALPPLNGFVGEWLLFQAILQSPEIGQWGLKIIVPAIGALVALSAALAAACFVRLFGIACLGRPRSSEASTAQEADNFSLASMFVLSAFCLLAGVLPGPIIDAFSALTVPLVHGALPPQSGIAWLSIRPLESSHSSYNGLLVFLFITASTIIAAVAIHRLASHRVRRAPAWDCGVPNPAPVAQYSASSFAQPIRRVFGGAVFRVTERVTVPAPGSLEPARFSSTTSDLTWDFLYAPIEALISNATATLNVLQFLTIRRYLTLVFFCLIALLLAAALWA